MDYHDGGPDVKPAMIYPDRRLSAPIVEKLIR